MPEAGNPQSLNRYAYASNNPTLYTDPSGYFSPEAIRRYCIDHYGDDWQNVYDAWQANETWWAALLEARPGDVLMYYPGEYPGGSHLQDYQLALIRGNAQAEGTEDDVLGGIEGLERLPTVFEEFRLTGDKDLREWAARGVTAVARFEGVMIRYWEPPSQQWGSLYFNLPGVFRPAPQQRIDDAGQGLTVGFGLVMEGEMLALGSEALSAGPLGVPVAVLSWALALWVGPSLYNIAVLPTE